MTKNARTVAMLAITAAIVVVLAFFLRDFLISKPKIATCPDGFHPTIDIRDFTIRYWVYSGKLEATVTDKAKLSAELDPKLLAQTSEALQESNEFRKYVIAGYNSCAITAVQYSQLGERFRTLDSLAREINSLILQRSLSPDEKKKLAGLISQYGDLARQRRP